MHPNHIILDQSFCNHFNITDVHKSFSGGQKHVFIVTKDGQKMALKLFHNFGDRELRELGLYKEYEALAGIPKIISEDSYNNDKIVFEQYIEGENLDNLKLSYADNPDLVIKLMKDICTIMQPIWGR